MKQLLTIAFMLACAASSAQDTLCVMFKSYEIINFDYETSVIIDRFDHKGDYELKVNSGEVVCLHLYDEKNRFRDVTTSFHDGMSTLNTFGSKNNTVYTVDSQHDTVVRVSKSRRKQ